MLKCCNFVLSYINVERGSLEKESGMPSNRLIEYIPNRLKILMNDKWILYL